MRKARIKTNNHNTFCNRWKRLQNAEEASLLPAFSWFSSGFADFLSGLLPTTSEGSRPERKSDLPEKKQRKLLIRGI
jgi:hypothetical protein